MASTPKLGPEPTLLSRKEIDALYETFETVIRALEELGVEYIVTGGTLLGAVRQHSLLFCDDDIDIAILELDGSEYEKVKQNLQSLLGKGYVYQVRPWEGGDRTRPVRFNNVFLDLFVLRRFECHQDLVDVVGVKKNGKKQSEAYINGIVQTMEAAAAGPSLFPCWQFSTRKAIEMWPKEVYRDHELFPLSKELKFGPIVNVKGPRMPVLLLKRAFGADCFEVYFPSASHQQTKTKAHKENPGEESLPPLTSAGGTTWEKGVRTPLRDEHFLPMQPISRVKRRPTLHNREALQQYLAQQEQKEQSWLQPSTNRTVIMDGRRRCCRLQAASNNQPAGSCSHRGCNQRSG